MIPVRLVACDNHSLCSHDSFQNQTVQSLTSPYVGDSWPFIDCSVGLERICNQGQTPPPPGPNGHSFDRFYRLGHTWFDGYGLDRVRISVFCKISRYSLWRVWENMAKKGFLPFLILLESVLQPLSYMQSPNPQFPYQIWFQSMKLFKKICRTTKFAFLTLLWIT